MVSVAYSEAAVEVLDILKHTRKEDVNKIPKKFIEFLENNKSKTYIANLDHTKTILEFRKKARENEVNYQKELNEKYNPDNLFKNKEKIIVSDDNKTNMTLQKVKKETFIQRIIQKIKEIFRR